MVVHLFSSDIDTCVKVASAPIGTQAASLDIEWVYHNSPITPKHKSYLAVSWNDDIYIGNCAVEGLATMEGIHSCPADALLDILHYHGIEDVFKWVDDVVIFWFPSASLIQPGSAILNMFPFDLSSIFNITTPLGVPWHLIETKGQYFASSIKYVDFLWDLESRHHCQKRNRLRSYPRSIISLLP